MVAADLGAGAVEASLFALGAFSGPCVCALAAIAKNAKALRINTFFMCDWVDLRISKIVPKRYAKFPSFQAHRSLILVLHLRSANDPFCLWMEGWQSGNAAAC